MPKVSYHDSSGIERTVDLGSEPLLIGRSSECQIQTQDGLVSRRHARIFYDGGYWIEDLGSANGVFIDNQRVPRAPLRPGDTALCGSLTIRLLPEIRPTGSAGRSQVVPMPPSAASSSLMLGGGAASAGTQPPAAMAVQPPPLPPSTLSPLQGTGAAAEALAQVQRELSDERRRRSDLEVALSQAQGQAREASAALSQAQSKAQGAERERDKLQQQCDKLQADLRSVLSGQSSAPAAPAAAPAAGDAEALAQLQEKLRLAERKIEQLSSDPRRKAGQPAAAAPPVAAAPPAPPPGPSPELTAALDQLREVERERDLLRQRVSQGGYGAAPAPVAAAAPALPARVRELLTQIKDGLADLGGSLRALSALGPDAEPAQESVKQVRTHLDEVLTLLPKG